jgi:hypothetical protein
MDADEDIADRAQDFMALGGTVQAGQPAAQIIGDGMHS